MSSYVWRKSKKLCQCYVLVYISANKIIFIPKVYIFYSYYTKWYLSLCPNGINKNGHPSTNPVWTKGGVLIEFQAILGSLLYYMLFNLFLQIEYFLFHMISTVERISLTRRIILGVFTLILRLQVIISFCISSNILRHSSNIVHSQISHRCNICFL